MCLTKNGKEKLEEFKEIVIEAEILVKETLKRLGISEEEFLLLKNTKSSLH